MRVPSFDLTNETSESGAAVWAKETAADTRMQERIKVNRMMMIQC
jgi:hypothetical protein